MSDNKFNKNSLEDEKTPLSVDEISALIRDLNEKEYEFDSVEMSLGERKLAISKLRKDFVEKLLLEKERFHRVFKTSAGSIYFQIKSGEILRAKIVSAEDFYGVVGQHFKFQPLLNNLFFLPVSEVEKVTAGDLYPGAKLKIANYEIGVCPFELNVRGFGSSIAFEEKEGFLNLVGTEVIKSNGEKVLETDHNLVGGYHVGHPIVEIIK